MTGAAILEALVVATEGMGGSTRARDLGGGDGRTVTQALERLERCGLVASSRQKTPRIYWTTKRGRDVDAILARITHARGGSFQPQAQAGITGPESYALR